MFLTFGKALIFVVSQILVFASSAYASGALVHIDNVTTSQKTDYVMAGGKTIARLVGNTPTYLHQDHLGSPNTGTSSNGLVSWREQYTPFGETLTSPLPNDDRDGFTGHIKDAATGLNYMQARYYDPLVGRFLSIDPVGFTSVHPFSYGRYTYVGNDPINLTDPTGECPWCIGALIGGGLQLAIEVKKGSFKGGWKSSFKAVGKIGVSAGAGATGAGLATKAAQLGRAVSVTKSAGQLAGGAVGTVTEGAIAGGVAGGLNEAGQQVVESGGITDIGAIKNAATVGAVVGGLAGGAQSAAKNLTAAGSGASRDVSSNFQGGSRGISGGARLPESGETVGVAAGMLTNAVASCATDDQC